MKFWDSSAILPLCIDEPHTTELVNGAKEDNSIVVWWGTVIECYSAISRLRRDDSLTLDEEDSVRNLLEILSESWIEIEPGKEVKDISSRLLRTHPLHAADSLQLSAAIIWAGKNPKGHHFVCLDRRLREAARKEGFTLHPAKM